MNIALPVIIVGGIGLLFGVILTVASIVMHVKSDDRIEQIMKILPGANCGGCGFTGCRNYAEGIIKNGVTANKCSVGGAKVAKEIAKILGISSAGINARFAVNICHGSNDLTTKKYQYAGINTCKAASMLYGGDTACPYGCIGLGDCVRACKFDAIRIINGVARIDVTRCTNCGMCIQTCPKNLIVSKNAKTKAVVLCSNKSKAKDTMSVCKGGCIGCGKCAKLCPAGAIEIKDNLAYIHHAACTGCGLCAENCPTHCIAMIPHMN